MRAGSRFGKVDLMSSSDKIQKNIGENVCKTAPKISIVTPAYNSSEFIFDTLYAVFTQTFQDFEIIVCNDGSPDTEDFERKIASFSSRIIYLKHENVGAGAARNIAIEHSRGEFIAFLDADDIWFPDFLSSQIEFLEKNKFDLVYADAFLFGNKSVKGKTFMETAPSKGNADFDALLDLRCCVITSGTLARKKCIVKAGMFEQEKVRAHDFVLWLKMAKNGAKIGYQQKQLLKYRVHEKSLSGNTIQQIRREIDVFERVKKNIELNENQKQTVENHLKRLEAAMDVERGKCFLVQRNFDSAKNAFRRANAFRQSLKLQMVIWLTLFTPGLLLKFYKYCRSEEMEIVSEMMKHI